MHVKYKFSISNFLFFVNFVWGSDAVSGERVWGGRGAGRRKEGTQSYIDCVCHRPPSILSAPPSASHGLGSAPPGGVFTASPSTIGVISSALCAAISRAMS